MDGECILGDSYVAMATIGAALVTGVISVVNLTVSKEHKISELRQAWIEEVRKDVAALLSEQSHILNSFTCENNLGTVNYWDFYSKHIDSMKTINEIHHRIKMRLNPIEHEIIISLLDDLDRSIVNPNQLSDIAQMTYLFDELNSLSQDLLKKEWERVKDGEIGFKKLKRASLIVTMLALIATMYINYK